MATVRNKQKLAARNKKNHDITQIWEEIAGSVSEKLSQEFSEAQSCILGALSRLD